MFKIEAIFRPERVNIVVDAAIEAGCTGFHLTNITGRGKQKGVEVFTGRGGSTLSRASLPKVLLTTVVAADMKEAVLNAILQVAKSSDSGSVGDGKIFVSPISEVVRVSTGERDEQALL